MGWDRVHCCSFKGGTLIALGISGSRDLEGGGWGLGEQGESSERCGYGRGDGKLCGLKFRGRRGNWSTDKGEGRATSDNDFGKSSKGT